MPTYPNWQPRQPISSTLLNAGLPLTVIKANDEPLFSSTALQNDNELVIASLPAGSVWQFRCYLDYEGAAIGTGDLKLGWTLPPSATLRYQGTGLGPGGGTNEQNTYTGAMNPVFGTKGAGNLCGVTLTGSLVVAATAGDLQLQWAQNTSSVVPTIVHAQSALTLIRSS